MSAMMQKVRYTEQENEAFYIHAAELFLESERYIRRDHIFDQDGRLNKDIFFELYIKKFNWSKGLFDDKKCAKRLRDGIQRYYKDRFKAEALERALNGQHPTAIAYSIRLKTVNTVEVQEAERLLQWVSFHTKRIHEQLFAQRIDPQKLRQLYQFSQGMIKADQPQLLSMSQTKIASPTISSPERTDDDLITMLAQLVDPGRHLRYPVSPQTAELKRQIEQRIGAFETQKGVLRKAVEAICTVNQ